MTKRYGRRSPCATCRSPCRPGIVTGFLGPERLRQVDDDAPDPRPRRARLGRRARQRQALPRPPGAAARGRARCSRRARCTPGARPTTTCSRSRRPTASARARVDELIELVGLDDVARKRAGKFSLGMGQRLGIASALLGDPQTVMLDEPVNGLDPEGIQWVRNLLKQLAAEGRTVFVSSHLMSEMALTAEHLIVIGRGRADRRHERRGVRPRRLQAVGAGPLAAGARLAELLAGPDVTRASRRAVGRSRSTGSSARADRRDSPPSTGSCCTS